MLRRAVLIYKLHWQLLRRVSAGCSKLLLLQAMQQANLQGDLVVQVGADWA